MVVLKIVTAWAPLILARIRTRTFATATLNALNDSLNYLLVGVKLPPLFDVKFHIKINLNLL